MTDEYQALQDRLGLHKGIPYTPNWSAASDFLHILVNYCLEHRPSLILECGSGLTTLMLARCCQLNGEGRVVSLEDGGEYAESARSFITRYGLESFARVVHAPLQKTVVGGAEYQWYSTSDIPDEAVDMLVVDGPSGFLQKHSRYPALPVLKSSFAKGCRIFLDDADRPDEREIVALWQSYLPELEHEYLDTARGCSVLMLKSEA